MYCWNPQNRTLIFQDKQFEGSHTLALLSKWMFSHPSPWESHINVCWNPSEQGLFTQTRSIWGVTCLGFTWKMNIFPSISLETNYMYVETLRYRVWSENNLRVTYLDLLWKWTILPSILRNHIIVCWNPQNRAHFSKTINFRVTCLGLLEKWTFSHLSPWNPMYMCVETPQNRAHFSKKINFEGSHAEALLWKMNIFPSISLENPINACCNPQNRAH